MLLKILLQVILSGTIEFSKREIFLIKILSNRGSNRCYPTYVLHTQTIESLAISQNIVFFNTMVTQELQRFTDKPQCCLTVPFLLHTQQYTENGRSTV